MDNIRQEIKAMAQPIGNFTTHPRNVRQGDVGAICASLEAHGQYRSIVVHQATNQILAGNHTYLAALALGWDKIAATFVDCDDEQALRILLTDNRANDLATYDDAGLAELLKELSVTDLALTGTMYDAADLDDLLALFEPPALQDVIDSLGQHNDSDFTAVIKVAVGLSVYQRWNDCYSTIVGATDDEKILTLLGRYERD